MFGCEKFPFKKKKKRLSCYHEKHIVLFILLKSKRFKNELTPKSAEVDISQMSNCKVVVFFYT